MVIVEDAEHGAEPWVPVGDVRHTEDGPPVREASAPRIETTRSCGRLTCSSTLAAITTSNGVPVGPRAPAPEPVPSGPSGPRQGVRCLAEVELGDLVAHGTEASGAGTFGVAQVQYPDRPSGTQQGADPVVRAVLSLGGFVVGIEGDATPVPEAGLLEPVGEDILHHVERIARSVHVADLVAVVRGNGNLGDAHAGVMELDDDLGVEVEPVRVPFERNLLQCADRIGAIAGVELGETGPERHVLESGQDPVAHELVQRHAPLPGRPLDHHPGSEHGVGLTGQERRNHVRQGFGSVLPVTVQHDHDVEAVFDGQLVAGLLVAPVSQIGRLPDEGDG